ncbi:MAG: hypothetical protein H0V13_11490, partial [Nocardioidaceae bacterium]|nr:hypothetical protein [Nocardioidaceae bacterium]
MGEEMLVAVVRSQPNSHASTLIAVRILGAVTVLGLAVLERSEAGMLVAALIVMIAVTALTIPALVPRWSTRA